MIDKIEDRLLRDKVENYRVEGKIDGFLTQVETEYLKARAKFGDFKSPHEGYAVILEELDELWELIKTNQGRSQKTREECIQISAMAMAYYLELSK